VFLWSGVVFGIATFNRLLRAAALLKRPSSALFEIRAPMELREQQGRRQRSATKSHKKGRRRSAPFSRFVARCESITTE
jgi:hypothetical protein